MLFKKLLSAFLCIAMVLSLMVAQAQDRTVTGTVTNSKDGAPVSGASVQVKDSKVGTSTRADGSFKVGS